MSKSFRPSSSAKRASVLARRTQVPYAIRTGAGPSMPRCITQRRGSSSACAALAARSRETHPRGLHLVCVLKGAFVFLADLVRAMEGDVTLDFMALSSYAAGHASRPAKCGSSRTSTPASKAATSIIVEDIVDTGLTLTYLQEILRARARSSLRTACLLSKPSSAQGRRAGRLHRLHDRGSVRRRLRPRLRSATATCRTSGSCAVSRAGATAEPRPEPVRPPAAPHSGRRPR